jgi:hypothetical protein
MQDFEDYESEKNHFGRKDENPKVGNKRQSHHHNFDYENEKEKYKKQTTSALFQNMYGEDIHSDGFDKSQKSYTSESEFGSDSKKHKYKNSRSNFNKKKQKKTNPNTYNEDDSGDNSDIEVEDEEDSREQRKSGDGQDNVGGDDKKQRENRFYGFKAKQFANLELMQGNRISEDEIEKKHNLDMFTKCNSTNMKERKLERDFYYLQPQTINSSISPHICRVCTYANINLYSGDYKDVDCFKASTAISQYDIASTGHKQELQKYNEMTIYYNRKIIENTKLSDNIPEPLTVAEVSNCYINHKNMNNKKAILKCIQHARELAKSAMLHVEGYSRDGQHIFQPAIAKFAMDMVEKECYYTEKMIKADIMLQGSGVLTTQKNTDGFSKMIGLPGKTQSNNRENSKNKNFFNFTAATGRYNSKTI